MSLHVSPHLRRPKPWAVRRAGSERASKLFDTKREAIAYAKHLAKGERIYIHAINGRIEQKID